MKLLILLTALFMPLPVFSQTPPIEPGVSHELAIWRAAHYSDVRYKLNLTLEKMSPVLKGTIEIRVNVGTRTPSSATPQAGEVPPIILDWRKIRGHEDDIDDFQCDSQWPHCRVRSPQAAIAEQGCPTLRSRNQRSPDIPRRRDHWRERHQARFHVADTDRGSAITRYIDKEDGSEYIYSLFVPSDASTAFPVFDQPDLKARFSLTDREAEDWKIISNTEAVRLVLEIVDRAFALRPPPECPQYMTFSETKPISTYVFAFAAGPCEEVHRRGHRRRKPER